MTAHRLAVFGCRHAPFGPRGPWETMLDEIAEFKPTQVINLGDWLEAGAASVHPNEYQHTLRDEYAAAAQDSREIRRVAPKAKLVWLLGNHDDNLQSGDPRRIPAPLRSSVHWNEDRDFGDEFRRWTQIPYVNGLDGVYQVGSVLIMHGWKAGRTSDRDEGLAAAHDAEVWHGLSVRAHTHRPVPPTPVEWGAKPLDWHYANVGTMGPLKPDYMKRLDSRAWGHGLLLIECGNDGWEAELVEIHSG